MLIIDQDIRILLASIFQEVADGHKELSVECLCASLLNIPDARLFLESLRLDIEQLKTKLRQSSYVLVSNRREEFFWVLSSAIHAVKQSSRGELNAASILDAIFRHGKSTAYNELRSFGVTQLDIQCFCAHGISSSDYSCGSVKTSLVELVMLNDNYTMIDYVIAVLGEIFGDYNKARDTALQVHKYGEAILNILQAEEAQVRAIAINREARADGYPLRCIVRDKTG